MNARESSICLFASTRASLFCQYHLSFGDGALSFETEFKIFLHLSYRHSTALEAIQALYPFDIVVTEDSVIVLVPLYIRNQILIAVELQVLIAHVRHLVRFFHRVHKFPVDNTLKEKANHD